MVIQLNFKLKQSRKRNQARIFKIIEIINYIKGKFMKKMMILIFGCLLISITAMQAGEHIKDAVIVLKSPTGKTYKGTTDASGRCVFRDLDCDGDGWSVQMKTDTYVWKQKTKSSFSVVDASSSSSQLRESPTKSSTKGTSSVAEESSVSSPRDAASGQATGKRMHKPFSYKTTLCPNGSCADSSVELTLESDGSTITCQASTKPVTKSSSNIQNN